MDRIKKIAIFLGILFVALVLRLAYIQIIGHDELSAVTRVQSLIALEGSNTRGVIYDRSGKALVADDKHYIYIIKSDGFDKKAANLLKRADAREISGNSEEHHVYASEKYDKRIGEELIEDHGAYILQASARYDHDQTAAHYIGYVNEGDSSGAAGLELMYDDVLSGLHRKVYAAADVNGNILQGRGLIIVSDAHKDSYVAEGIRTALDKDLQQEVEKIIETDDDDCAVVVLDSKTGGIAAMASTPKFDPGNIERYVGTSGDELMNKAAQGEYAPGSVFKIITAAAALEKGIDPDRTYVCSGFAELNGLTIDCDTGGETGHGEISFEEAFAVSCNSFFVQLAEDTGAEDIISTAKEMGLGSKVIDGYPQEAEGHVMNKQESAGNAIGNLSIGQGETLVTPLQVAAMTNIIASGGIDRGVHILMDEEREEERILSEKTASIIGKMMEETAGNGTGSTLGLVGKDGKVKAAVKTGTAEYGVKELETAHGWITGYTPCDEPEYVITVLVDGGGSGSGSAGPILKKIIEYLEESGSYSRPTLA